jgi:uncharacterized protein YjdB
MQIMSLSHAARGDASPVRRTVRRVLVTAAVLLLLPSCEAGTLDPRVTPEMAVGSLVLNSSDLELAEGDTFRLETTVLNKNGAVIGRSGQTSSGAVGYYKLDWSSSDPQIATVDETGLVEAVDSGSTVISVSSGPVRTSAKAKVNRGKGGGGGKGTGTEATDSTEPEPARVTVTPDGAKLTAIGASLRLAATVYDSTGATIDSASVSWASKNPEIATVDSTGTVTAKLAGAAFVIAASGGLADTAAIEVEQVVSTVTVSPSSASLEVGDSVRLVAMAADVNGTEVPEISFTWSSADAAVATVSSTGMVKGVSGGSATVTATASGTNVKATAAVTVQEAEAAPPPPPTGPLAAFPGAEGWGATALANCRLLPIEVLTVTNLANSGSGTLRQAVADARSDRYSIIVFRTGGTIEASEISLDKACLYIAGQTAPGGGVQLRGPSSGAHTSLRIPREGTGNNIVMRFIRVRPGKGTPGEGDAISINGGTHIAFDHVSIQWANDENIGFQTITSGGNPLQYVTIQRSIIAEALRTHSAGVLIGGDPLSGQPKVSNLSFHGNLFAHNAHRNPRIAENGPVEFTNNVLYNWHSRVGETRYRAKVDYINNYLRAGPWVGSSRIWYHDARTEGSDYDPSIYISGNIAEPKQPDPNTDNRKLVEQLTDAGFSAAPSRFFRSSPIGGAEIPITVRSAEQAYTSVLGDVGANARLDCVGNWVNVMDRVDRDVIDHVIRKSGPSIEEEIDHQSDFGGYPTLPVGTPCADSDGDGMPDEWEARHFDCPTCAKPGEDRNQDGYLNIEAYLNGTQP